ncbi:hypothetical protein BH09BAC4_BH09BAC4_28170 [soil metagenome]
MADNFISLNPLRSSVGLRGLDTVVHTWVNDLPGLSTELVADLALPSDSFGLTDPEPALAVWDSVHRNAYTRLVSESLLLLSEHYDYQPVIARTHEPQRAKPAATTGLLDAGQFVGALVTAPYAPYSTVNLRSLTVFVTPNGMPDPQPVSAIVRVLDADTNALFYSAPHLFSFGLNTLDLNLPFRTMMLESLSLVVLVEAKMFLTELTLSGWSDDNYTIEGVRTIAPHSLSDSLSPEKTYVSLDVEVTRSIDVLLGKYVADLRTAYGYLCGSLLMTEKLASPNLSVFTLSNLQFTERMEAKLCDDFKRALKPVIRRLSNELLQQTPVALATPVPTPNEYEIRYGSYV